MAAGVQVGRQAGEGELRPLFTNIREHHGFKPAKDNMKMFDFAFKNVFTQVTNKCFGKVLGQCVAGCSTEAKEVAAERESG
jgi:hypothetical protein